MYIIEVIPIVRGTGAETLSYFCPVPIILGSIVNVPVRKKIVQGVVISAKEAIDVKSELKQASFSLKKISADEATRAPIFFNKEFMTTAQKTAEYYAATVGSVLAGLVPEIILSKIDVLRVEPLKKKNDVSEKTDASAEVTAATETKTQPKKPEPAKPVLSQTQSRRKFFEMHAIQGDDEERYGSYRGLIRQEFARKASVLVLVPTAEEAEHAYELLEKGIEGYAHILHSGLSKKRLLDNWNQIIDEDHPVAIVATPAFLSIPRNDLGAIMLEKENSRGWKMLRRPYADMRVVTEYYARERNIPLYVGDMFLSVETLWRQAEDEIIAGAPFKFRTLSTSHETLVDMKQYKNEQRGSFKILSETAENLIKKNRTDSEHMIIFALRRGHAPSVVCADCQTIVTCNECSKPVVLHRAPGKAGVEAKSFFLCHRCGARRPSEEMCKNCGSWKLATVGIGIDLVAEKIRDKFPDVKLFQIDSDATPSEKQAKAIIAEFRAQPGSILLGTEMMLTYLHEKADNALIVSLDSLLSIPDFRINEKILRILLAVRNLTRREFVVQTRKADEKIFDYALKGTLNEFFRSALAERKMFSYPPYSTLIKLTLEGKKDEIVAEMGEIKKQLEEIKPDHSDTSSTPYSVDIFPAFTHTVRGNFVLHGLIRIPRVSATVSRPNWPDAKLSAALRSLPPSVTVNIDPDTLL